MIDLLITTAQVYVGVGLIASISLLYRHRKYPARWWLLIPFTLIEVTIRWPMWVNDWFTHKPTVIDRNTIDIS